MQNEPNPPQRQQQEELLQALENAKTDPHELADLLAAYDFDDAIVNEYNRVSEQFQRLRQQFHTVSHVTSLRLNDG